MPSLPLQKYPGDDSMYLHLFGGITRDFQASSAKGYFSVFGKDDQLFTGITQNAAVIFNHSLRGSGYGNDGITPGNVPRNFQRRYKIVMWDLVTRDYSKWLTADDVVRNVKRYTRNGSIITFHDSLKSIDKLKTALPEALEWLQEQGYEFKTFE